MRPTAKTVDAYLAKLPADQRVALQKVRAAIRAAAPDAEECMSYGIPAFRRGGRILLHFGAAARHCSVYPGARPVHELAAELAAYDTSKGTVRFPAARPLPVALVKRLVRVRIAEQDEARAGAGVAKASARRAGVAAAKGRGARPARVRGAARG